MDSKLYVGNLPFTTSEEQLRVLFAQAGTVNKVSILNDRETGRSRGFAFIEMASPNDAAKAIKMFNDYKMDNRALVVNIARPREERPMGGGGGGGGREGGRDRDRGGHGGDRRRGGGGNRRDF